jgi:hypothetical protein
MRVERTVSNHSSSRHRLQGCASECHRSIWQHASVYATTVSGKAQPCARLRPVGAVASGFMVSAALDYRPTGTLARAAASVRRSSNRRISQRHGRAEHHDDHPQRTMSRGSDRTSQTAINTPGMPPSVSPRAARAEQRPLLGKRIAATMPMNVPKLVRRVTFSRDTRVFGVRTVGNKLAPRRLP